MTFVIGIVCLIASAYMYYRTYFINYHLADEKDLDLSATKLLKKGFGLTSGWKKLGKFITLWIIFIVIFMPFNYVVNNNSDNIEQHTLELNQLYQYDRFMENDAETRQIIEQNEPIKVAALKDAVQGLSNDEITKSVQTEYILSYIYIFVSFLFSYGLVELYFLGYYRKKIQSNI
jgi:hypothetical protein